MHLNMGIIELIAKGMPSGMFIIINKCSHFNVVATQTELSYSCYFVFTIFHHSKNNEMPKRTLKQTWKYAPIW